MELTAVLADLRESGVYWQTFHPSDRHSNRGKQGGVPSLLVRISIHPNTSQDGTGLTKVYHQPQIANRARICGAKSHDVSHYGETTATESPLLK